LEATPYFLPLHQTAAGTAAGQIRLAETVDRAVGLAAVEREERQRLAVQERLIKATLVVIQPTPQTMARVVVEVRGQ
jgi:hypothetical protein